LYAIVYTQQSTGPAYFVHALDLGSLTDKVTPQLVTGSHTLTGGTTFTFNATYQRQRPALLLANGNVYAAFGSFCDRSPNLSRGWVLGWQTGTLTPLPGNQLMDTQATDTGQYFLSSIWMSGYGPAADDSGNILFVTSNSDPSGNTYDGVTNIQESVVHVSSDLTTVLDLFTPDNVGYLDENDLDFGSGGVMVLPDQPGSIPHLAVAAGKVGSMFFMNEDDLGGYSTETNNVLGTYTIGACWCGPSYFRGSQGWRCPGGEQWRKHNRSVEAADFAVSVSDGGHQFSGPGYCGDWFFHERIFERHRRPDHLGIIEADRETDCDLPVRLRSRPGRNHHDATFHGHRRHLVSEWREQQPGSGSSQRKSFLWPRTRSW